MHRKHVRLFLVLLQPVDLLESPICKRHCTEGSKDYVDALDSCFLPNVDLSLKSFAPQVHKLLQSHEGAMQLMRQVEESLKCGPVRLNREYVILASPCATRTSWRSCLCVRMVESRSSISSAASLASLLQSPSPASRKCCGWKTSPPFLLVNPLMLR